MEGAVRSGIGVSIDERRPADIARIELSGSLRGTDEPRPHHDNPAGSDPRGFASPYRAELHGAWQQIEGYTDSPDRATAQQGELYLATIVGEVTRALREFDASARAFEAGRG